MVSHCRKSLQLIFVKTIDSHAVKHQIPERLASFLFLDLLISPLSFFLPQLSPQTPLSLNFKAMIHFLEFLHS